MHGGCPYAAGLMTPVKFHSKQDVCCLGAAIGAKLRVGRVLDLPVTPFCPEVARQRADTTDKSEGYILAYCAEAYRHGETSRAAEI
jgi:hypothetical protein